MPDAQDPYVREGDPCLMTSEERVRATLAGRVPDRPATFDCLMNDAIIRHFAGEEPDLADPKPVVHRAIAAALDSTRIIVVYPQAEGRETRADGSVIRKARWTTWYPHAFASAADAEQSLRAQIPLIQESPPYDLSGATALYRETRAGLGDTFLFANYGLKTGLMLYSSIGLECFCELLADCPEVVSDYIEACTAHSVASIEALRIPPEIEAVFDCEDIAYRGGPLFSPAFLRREFIPRLERIADAWHRKGLRFIFHSDGNLMPVLPDLVAAGIDGLNPIETQSGMTVAGIRRVAPDLLLIGGIDCSQILPNGTPAQVRAETRKVLREAGPRILVGASSETHNAVPLENYLAFLETVHHWQWEE